MLPRGAVQRALQGWQARDDTTVLDVVADSDLEGTVLFSAPRRLQFHRDGLHVDALVHDGGGELGRQALLRVTPAGHYVVRAASLGPELTVVTATGRTDGHGVTRLTGIPGGITSFHVEGALPSLVRTAWVRL